jgi:hypothetical protein
MSANPLGTGGARKFRSDARPTSTRPIRTWTVGVGGATGWGDRRAGPDFCLWSVPIAGGTRRGRSASTLRCMGVGRSCSKRGPGSPAPAASPEGSSCRRYALSPLVVVSGVVEGSSSGPTGAVAACPGSSSSGKARTRSARAGVGSRRESISVGTAFTPGPSFTGSTLVEARFSGDAGRIGCARLVASSRRLVGAGSSRRGSVARAGSGAGGGSAVGRVRSRGNRCARRSCPAPAVTAPPPRAAVSIIGCARGCATRGSPETPAARATRRCRKCVTGRPLLLPRRVGQGTSGA